MNSSKPITSRMHGMFDYIGGIALIIAPWLFAFSDLGGAAVWVPIILGIAIILQSLITDYELSIAKIIPMRVHLGVDMLGGLVLAASPFIFGFIDEAANAWLPHIIVGLTLIAAAALTQSVPGGRHGDSHAHSHASGV